MITPVPSQHNTIAHIQQRDQVCKMYSLKLTKSNGAAAVAAAAAAPSTNTDPGHAPFRMLIFMYCTAISGVAATVSLINCTVMHSCSDRSDQALSTGQKKVPCARGFCGKSKRVARRHQFYFDFGGLPLPATHCNAGSFLHMFL
jgi:hypothetical protein